MNNTTNQHMSFKNYAFGLIFYSATAVSAFAIILNFIVMVIFATSKKLWKKQNIFIFSLVMTDILGNLGMCLGVFEKSTKENIHYESHGNHGEVIWIYVAFSSTSMLTLAAVAMDRFIALVWKPFNYDCIITVRRCIIVCIMLWIIPFITYSLIGVQHMTMLFSISFYLSLLLISCLYIKIFQCLNKSNSAVLQQNPEECKRSKKLLKTFLIIIGAFVICWLPISVQNVIFTAGECGNSKNCLTILSIFMNISTLNSLANPIIYWLRLSEFRSAVLTFFQRWVVPVNVITPSGPA
ncbi:beta-4C adrenergic receptor-like [Anneissia japonica]|uniref:beta-4C adrenergic receptor-like n=1 Tax=Anneissia japonica TaxID=1529436 RepID=UPI001425663C|nr:beta-4C adrenergic receptor-like [Anneissia japonica]